MILRVDGLKYKFLEQARLNPGFATNVGDPSYLMLLHNDCITISNEKRKYDGGVRVKITIKGLWVLYLLKNKHKRYVTIKALEP